MISNSLSPIPSSGQNWDTGTQASNSANHQPKSWPAQHDTFEQAAFSGRGAKRSHDKTHERDLSDRQLPPNTPRGPKAETPHDSQKRTKTHRSPSTLLSFDNVAAFNTGVPLHGPAAVKAASIKDKLERNIQGKTTFLAELEQKLAKLTGKDSQREEALSTQIASEREKLAELKLERDKRTKLDQDVQELYAPQTL